jgi:signal transduction histidine kinase
VEIAGHRSTGRRSLRLRVPAPLTLIVGSVAAAAFVTSVVAVVRLETFAPATLGGVAVLLVASTVAEAFPVPIVGVAAGETSLATIFIVGSAVIYSWPVATLVGLLTMVVVEARRRMRPLKAMYNTSLYVLSGAAAGLAAAVTPGGSIAATLAGSAAFYATDIGLLTAVIAVSGGERYLAILAKFGTSTLAPFLVMASTTAILVELWDRSELLGLLLLAPLVAIASYQRSLNRAMERQRELDRLKEEFVAVVSHELRTPLSTVYGGVETLQRPGLPPAHRERLFAAIRQEAARLAKLVDDVLWASRLDAHHDAATPDAVDPVAVIEEVTGTAATLAPDAVTVRTATLEPLPNIAAQREHVELVLRNLIDNAVKYSPDGGTVEIEATHAGRSVRFAVKDEGIGIPLDRREHVFEKFTRLDPQMTQGISGTGLGLYICRELVHRMGGEIWCLPNGGRGTTFTFEIPVTT